ncbi:unnamed protein product [Allacma fusca]|uniref:Uncharacterized protein n=1 Tax=Allacma fusca TaxID=39272 RepID=A0A8J2NJY9_9HEXA|nr:unnamed protein product [Allacma fusca]
MLTVTQDPVIMITNTTSRKPEFLDAEGSEEEPESTRDILLDLRKDVKVSKNTLEKLTLDVNLISKSLDTQRKRMDTLEKKVDSSLSKQDAEIVHLRNDLIQQKCAANSRNAIISGVKLNQGASNDEILKAIDPVISATSIASTQIEKADALPWSGGFAVKVIFRDSASCGTLLRNSFKLKGSNYHVRPDLSPEQRAVKAHLIEFDGSGQKFFESDGTKAVRAKKEWIPAPRVKKTMVTPGSSQTT